MIRKFLSKPSNWVIIAILILASSLRLFKIDQFPQAIYGDGLTLVYDAYSLSQTGHDQKGNFLPLVFSLGGARPPLYVYATIPFVALLGLNNLSANAVSILSGIGLVILMYFLGKLLFSPKVGLIAALALAINPWDLSLSRGPFETHLALFLTVFGIFSFLKSDKNNNWLVVSLASLGLSMFAYPTYRLSSPLILMALIFCLPLFKFKISSFKKPLNFLSLCLFIALFTLSIYLSVSRGSDDRFLNINLLNQPDLKLKIIQKVNADRLVDSLSPELANKIHTKQWELVSVWAQNYLSNFTPDFLFFYGDGSPRHNPAGMGGFFWVTGILIVLGVYYLAVSKHRALFFLFCWIAIAPLATSIVGPAHALRSSLLIPPLILIASFGLVSFIYRSHYSNPLTKTALILIFLIQIPFFIDRFYLLSPNKYADFWSLPARQSSAIAQKYQNQFDEVFLSNNIDNMEFAYPVYAKLPPNLVISQNKTPTKIGEFSFFKYGNIYIGSLPYGVISDFIKNRPGKVLYVGSAKEQDYLENHRLFRNSNQEPSIVVTTNSNQSQMIELVKIE